MGYKILKPFLDRTDSKKPYKKGDSYSHEDDDRISFLIKEGYLEEKSKQPPKKEVKHIGGGYYELPNGEKVKGKKEALSALESGE